MKRITKAALGSLVGGALVLAGTQLASGGPPHVTYAESGVLTDLQLSRDVPLDGASWSIRIVESADEGTGFRLRVTGIETIAEGREFGAHLHVGPCTLLQDGTNLTGGHYKDDNNPPSPANEVWFSLVPDEEGNANDETWVSFRPYDNTTPGVMSIVIHEHEADVLIGNTKEACLPVLVPEWGLPRA